ncbi:TatD family hydrolase [Candidatus Kinetoplastidibacterium galati]|nr:TatD family hydrolase [Candidatus Kinetoplastibacterium galatii]
MFLIDTHCHLDDVIFRSVSSRIYQRAQSSGVKVIIAPSTNINNFDIIKNLAHNYEGVFYSLGIHPLSINLNSHSDLNLLYKTISNVISDKKFIGVGEIGLDFRKIYDDANIYFQKEYFVKQLLIAEEFSLPLIIHSVKSQDIVLSLLKKRHNSGGIIHSFSGSYQQAISFINLGFLLGFGGSITYKRNTKVRHNASSLPLDSIVLETDSPYMLPSWLTNDKDIFNTPCEIVDIALVLSRLRNCSIGEIASSTTKNVVNLIPKLNYLNYIDK